MTISDLAAPCAQSPVHSNKDTIVGADEIISTMVNLRLELNALEQKIQALQPAFFAACASLNTDSIQLEQAVITKRLTPAQWAYPPDILEQESALKQLKRQFQQEHEPTGGREITWSLKLLLNR